MRTQIVGNNKIDSFFLTRTQQRFYLFVLSNCLFRFRKVTVPCNWWSVSQEHHSSVIILGRLNGLLKRVGDWCLNHGGQLALVTTLRFCLTLVADASRINISCSYETTAAAPSHEKLSIVHRLIRA